MTHSLVPMADYLRVIGRGKDGARSLNRTQAQDLMTRLLAGQLSDLERGGFALAMRIKGESAEELLGFTAAVQDSLPAVSAQIAGLEKAVEQLRVLAHHEMRHQRYFGSQCRKLEQRRHRHL